MRLPEMHTLRPATDPKPVRVMVIDDDPEYLDFVTALLREIPESFEPVGAFICAGDALKQLDDVAPDVALVDVVMPDIDGITCAREISRRRPKTAVAVVSGAATQLYYQEAFQCGACGFLSKPFLLEQLKATIFSAASGLSVLSRSVMGRFCDRTKTGRLTLIRERHLTDREVQALDLLACFLENKTIADRMHLSLPLTQKILHSAFEKLGAGTRSEAITIWNFR
jgi:DNA-binding NarL/FixJ family response regulator